jgi:hypothetical protein
VVVAGPVCGPEHSKFTGSAQRWRTGFLKSRVYAKLSGRPISKRNQAFNRYPQGFKVRRHHTVARQIGK